MQYSGNGKVSLPYFFYLFNELVQPTTNTHWSIKSVQRKTYFLVQGVQGVGDMGWELQQPSFIIWSHIIWLSIGV